MSNQFVDYENYNPEHMKGSEPIPKEIQKDKETIKYNDVKLSYNYGTEQKPNIQDVYFEGCMVTSNGIKKKEDAATGKNGPYTKTSYSMMNVFNVVDPEYEADSLKCLGKITELYQKARNILFQHRNKLKMHDFTAEGQGGLFKFPVYWPRDEVTGEVVAGKNPNIWVKLREKYNKTLFTDLNGNPVEWSLLEGAEVTMVPLYHFEKVYVGSKASMQVYLASAIIIKIKKIGSETRQMSTIDRLKQKYGAAAEELESQIAEMRMEKQDVLADNISTGQMHTEINVPAETEASLHDFLSEAPSMNTEQVNTETAKPTTIRLPISK